MRVCILNVLHEPFDKRVFQKVARSLVAAGHDVVSICPATGPVEGKSHGVQFITVPPAHSFVQRFLAVGRLVNAGRPVRADVYLAPEAESWVAALVLKKLTGAKVVFDMHEHVPTEFAKFFPRFSRGFIEWLTLRFMRLFARFTDHILLTRESFEAPWKGLRTPRTVVINTNHLQTPCADIPKALREDFAAQPTIIHQGIFGDVRGSYQLLEAMKILVQDFSDLRCIVLGSYVYGSESEYKAAIASAGLNEHIDLIPVVAYEEVPAYIAVARIGLILFQPGPLNHTLAMPHKLFDYMREGRPVVAPDFAIEVAHIVKEADCGLLIDVTDPRAIAGAIAHLLRNPEEAKRLGANGRRLIESKYHWEADEARLLEAVASLEHT